MRLFSSELLKLRTIRTSYVLLLGSAAISAVAAAGFVGSGSVDRGDDDPALALGQGASFGTLFAAGARDPDRHERVSGTARS